MNSMPPPPPVELSPSVDRQQVSDKVSGPAVGLMVTAGLGIVIQILGLAMSVLNIGMGGLDSEAFSGGEMPEWAAMMASGTLAIVMAIIGVAIGLVILYAAVQMRKLNSWGLALAASIIAMIPCVSPCCIIGLPIGIWSLVVLTKPEVKAAFN